MQDKPTAKTIYTDHTLQDEPTAKTMYNYLTVQDKPTAKTSILIQSWTLNLQRLGFKPLK